MGNLVGFILPLTNSLGLTTQVTTLTFGVGMKVTEQLYPNLFAYNPSYGNFGANYNMYTGAVAQDLNTIESVTQLTNLGIIGPAIGAAAFTYFLEANYPKWIGKFKQSRGIPPNKWYYEKYPMKPLYEVINADPDILCRLNNNGPRCKQLFSNSSQQKMRLSDWESGNGTMQPDETPLRMVRKRRNNGVSSSKVTKRSKVSRKTKSVRRKSNKH